MDSNPMSAKLKRKVLARVRVAKRLWRPLEVISIEGMHWRVTLGGWHWGGRRYLER